MEVLEELDQARIGELRQAGRFFWLELCDPDRSALDELGELFELNKIALEDSEEFGQRPKLDDYGRYALLVFYGLDGERPTEVHAYISGEAIVTIRRGHVPGLREAKRRMRENSPRSEEEVVYRVLDALTDSWLDGLEATDDRVEELEQAVVERSDGTMRQELVDLRRTLIGLRRVVGPQRDAMASAIPVIQNLEEFDADHTRNLLRDVSDHLARIADELDSQRELLFGALQMQDTAVANRTNAASTQLALVGTIFLPLTFVTGFFGQNFAWLTDHISPLWAFLAYGVGGMVLSLVALAVWIRRRGITEEATGTVPPHGSGSQPGRAGHHRAG